MAAMMSLKQPNLKTIQSKWSDFFKSKSCVLGRIKILKMQRNNLSRVVWELSKEQSGPSSTERKKPQGATCYKSWCENEVTPWTSWAKRKAPFKRKLNHLLLQIFEAEERNVDMHYIDLFKLVFAF